MARTSISAVSRRLLLLLGRCARTTRPLGSVRPLGSLRGDIGVLLGRLEAERYRSEAPQPWPAQEKKETGGRFVEMLFSLSNLLS